jgi:cytochrome c peroxidase
MLACVLFACGDSPSTTIAAEPVPVPVHKARHVTHPSPTDSAQQHAFYTTDFSRQPTVTELQTLGLQAFGDKSLSRDHTLACASCHDPAHAFGPVVDRPGLRVAPSLRYLQSVPRFTEHFIDPDIDSGEDQGPSGGLTWDGRAQSLHDQARSPLFSIDEMANASEHELATRLATTPLGAKLRAVFGDDVFADDDRAMKGLLLALEDYQQEPSAFYPYSSKFDAVIKKTAEFTPAEDRGKHLFDNPAKGNCARCHPDVGPAPAFSDFGMVALGVPARKGAALDLGLCGPRRTDYKDRADYCGKFRTPSLRNVATRKRLFHNGSATSLTEAVTFYATRDATPAAWKSDLPAKYLGNLDVAPPFGSKSPTLTAAEIADIVAFLGTLTDH